MTEQITFKYNHCSLKYLQKDVSFNEVLFKEILEGCFETNQKVSSVDVIFEVNPAQATNKFCCAINVRTAGKIHHLKEAGESAFSSVVTQACHKAVRIVRSDNRGIDHKLTKTEF